MTALGHKQSLLGLLRARSGHLVAARAPQAPLALALPSASKQLPSVDSYRLSRYVTTRLGRKKQEQPIKVFDRSISPKRVLGFVFSAIVTSELVCIHFGENPPGCDAIDANAFGAEFKCQLTSCLDHSSLRDAVRGQPTRYP